MVFNKKSGKMKAKLFAKLFLAYIVFGGLFTVYPIKGACVVDGSSLPCSLGTAVAQGTTNPDNDIYIPEIYVTSVKTAGPDNVLIPASNRKGNCDTVGSWYCDVRSRNARWNPKTLNDAFGSYDINTFKNLSSLDQDYVPITTSPPQVTNDGCCPSSFCWNGSACVNSLQWYDEANEVPWYVPDTDTRGCGYRCINGTYDGINGDIADWSFSCLKFNWLKDEGGYCNFDKECFVSDNSGKDCVRTGIFIDSNSELVSEQFNIRGNHFCLNGTWTTRTVLLARELLNYTNTLTDLSNKRFSIYCDNPQFVFNLPDMPDSSNIETACVLQYYKGNDYEINEMDRVVIFGAALNDISISDFFSNVLDETCTISDENYNFVECSGSSKKYWYNNGTRTIIFSKDEPLTSLKQKSVFDYVKDWYQDPLGTIINYFLEQLNEPTVSYYINLALNGTNINALYFETFDNGNSGNPKKITAYIDTKLDNGVVRDLLTVRYEGFTNDVCNSIEDTLEPYPSNKIYGDNVFVSLSTKCSDEDVDGDGVVDVYQITDIDEQDSMFTVLWNDLTSKLRVRYGK